MRGAYVHEVTSADRAATGLHPASRRVLQVVPPALAWIVITSPAWAAIVAPHLLGYFLVAFSAYWLWRSLQFTAGFLIGPRRMAFAQRRDWPGARRPPTGFRPPRPPAPRPPYNA